MKRDLAHYYLIFPFDYSIFVAIMLMLNTQNVYYYALQCGLAKMIESTINTYAIIDTE